MHLRPRASSALHGAATLVPLLLAALSRLACGGGVDLPPAGPSPRLRPVSIEPAVHSARLADLLPVAEIAAETRRIDFVSLQDIAPLGAGWSFEPSLEKAWGIGRSSSIEFRVYPPRALEIELRCAPFRFPDSPRQRVVVSINGREVARRTLWPWMWNYTITVPEEVLRFGVNEMELAYDYAASPAETLPDSEDPRRLAVLFEHIRFGEESVADPPEPAANGGGLFLPFGSQVSFYLQPGGNSALRLPRVEPRASHDRGTDLDWRLRVEVEVDESREPWQIDLAPQQLDEPVEVSLPGTGMGRFVRVTMTAYASVSAAGLDAGLELTLPEVVSSDPGTGVDRSAAARANPAPPPAGRPNILIYVIDTLRADHLGCYGYDRPTSPRIDAFARDATLFRHAVAQSSWTKASVASIITGLLPQQHGANGRDDALSGEVTTLAEYLREDGYDTAAIVTNGNIFDMGVDQGYMHYQHLREGTSRSIHVLSDGLHERAMAWLDQRDRTKPFYLYLHSTDPHAPYTPRAEDLARIGVTVEDFDAGLASRVAELRHNEVEASVLHDLVALYDAEIAFNDLQFGRLLDELERRGLYEDTLIVLVADHGEEFFDHGWWQHGKTLYQEQIAVPLIVRFPHGAGAGLEVEAVAQQIDLVPTILEMIGQEPAIELPGRSLWTAVTSGPSARPIRAVSYLNLDGRRAESLTGATEKLILHHYDPGQGPLLFDLAEDPGEKHNLYARRPVLAGFLHSALKAVIYAHSKRFEPEVGEVDPELAERLRALGYL